MDTRIEARKNRQKVIFSTVRVLLIINMIYLVVVGDWTNVAAVGAALVASFFPELFRLILKVETPYGFNLFGLIFILLSQWAGTYLRAYDIFPWWDVFLHGLSAVLIGFVGIILIGVVDRQGLLIRNKAYGMIGLIVFLTDATSAVLWEIGEYYGDMFLGTNAQLGSLVDTMEDMIICVVIGIFFSLYIYYILKKNKKNYITREIHTFLEGNIHADKH